MYIIPKVIIRIDYPYSHRKMLPNNIMDEMTATPISVADYKREVIPLH